MEGFPCPEADVPAEQSGLDGPSLFIDCCNREWLEWVEGQATSNSIMRSHSDKSSTYFKTSSIIFVRIVPKPLLITTENNRDVQRISGIYSRGNLQNLPHDPSSSSDTRSSSTRSSYISCGHPLKSSRKWQGQDGKNRTHLIASHRKAVSI